MECCQRLPDIIIPTQESPPTRWDKLVEAADLASEPWIFKPNPKKSLVQLFHILHKNIDETFAQPMVRNHHQLINYIIMAMYGATIGTHGTVLHL